MISTLKLDHTKKSLNEAFGLSDFDEHYVKTAIVFETISNHIKVRDLYDSPDEAPAEMTSTSGVLEAVLKHATSQEMRDYMLLMFKAGFHSVSHSLAELESAKEEKEEKGEDPIRKLMRKLVMTLKTEGLKVTIQKVRDCNHNFKKFVEQVLNPDTFQKDKGAADDIDRLLGGILGKKDEDED